MAQNNMSTGKIDYKKELKQLYGGKVGELVIVNVPKMNFLMIDGQGDPSTSPEYAKAIQTLYPLAYTIKFICKLAHESDFSVLPLESLWWTEDISTFSASNKNDWQWTAMIMQPPVVTEDIFAEALQKVKIKEPALPVQKVRFASYDEGRSAQMLYVGAYANEGPAIERLHAFIKEQGGVLNESNKHHHEIYLSDPRRTDVSKLKTIIRQPF